MNRIFLRQLLTSDLKRLLITAEGLSAAVMEAFAMEKPTSFFFNDNPPTYKDLSTKALSLLQQEVAHSELQGVTLTDDYASQELPEGSIAYHRIWGFITADSRWYFSSKQFELDLLAAEANPAITCHFLHANSPGGEAWYIDRLTETMRACNKPIISLVEKLDCSACYYITCHSDYIASLTAYDTIGCIGTMIESYNYDGWFEQNGIKRIIARATKADLKNKKLENLQNGKPEQYIKEELDPLNEKFLAAVLASRPGMSSLEEDDPVFRGETFDTQHAIEKGLIDGSMTFIEAVAKAVELGRNYTELENVRKKALNYI